MTKLPKRRIRNGRKVPNHIYLQLGDEPSDDDPEIGVMFTHEWGEWVVNAINTTIGVNPDAERTDEASET